MKNLLSNLTFFVTTECNLRCPYCFCKDKYKAVMDISTVEKGLLLLKHSEEKRKSICLFGGEPLLQKKFVFNVISRVKNEYSSFHISMTTNGVFLTPDIYQSLCSEGVNVTLSIDAFGEENDRTRISKNRKSAWSYIINNISNFNQLDLLNVRMTVIPETVHQLSNNINKMIKFGIKNIAFYLDFNSKWTQDAVEEYRIQFNKVLKLYCKHNKGLYIDTINKYLYLMSKERINIRRCRYGWSSLAIVPSGKVYMCHRQALDNSCEDIGNLSNVDNLFYNLNARSKAVMDEADKYYLNYKCGICPMYMEKGEKQTLDLMNVIDKIHINEISAMT